jgi:hypothetical protein
MYEMLVCTFQVRTLSPHTWLRTPAYSPHTHDYLHPSTVHTHMATYTYLSLRGTLSNGANVDASLGQGLCKCSRNSRGKGHAFADNGDDGHALEERERVDGGACKLKLERGLDCCVYVYMYALCKYDVLERGLDFALRVCVKVYQYVYVHIREMRPRL